MQKLLFVCTGNTCRSPMAAVMAKEKYKTYPGLCVISRGLTVIAPSRASDNAISAVRTVMGCDLRDHVSRQITQSDVDEASLIIAMTRSQKTYVKSAFSAEDEKIMTIYEAAGYLPKDIEDPFGGDVFVYKNCAEDIKSCFNQSFDEIIIRLMNGGK